MILYRSNEGGQEVRSHGRRTIGEVAVILERRAIPAAVGLQHVKRLGANDQKPALFWSVGTIVYDGDDLGCSG